MRHLLWRATRQWTWNLHLVSEHGGGDVAAACREMIISGLTPHPVSPEK